MSRRTLLTIALLSAPAFSYAQDACAGARDVRLTNAKVMTMDARNSTATELTIQNGRIAAVGPAGNLKLNPCTRTINLRGRTVVHGLIDNHNHIVLLGMRPGHDIRIETAVSIPEVQAMLKAPA